MTKPWTDAEVKGLIRLWGMGEPETLAPCPNCEREPMLEVENVGRDLVAMRFACRRWLGLRTCFLGPEHLEEYNWQDYGRRGATALWNDAVRKAVRKVQP